MKECDDNNIIKTTDKNHQDFLIVGIGASAGGIIALREFFSNVPSDSQMAFVVILHLSPDFDSKLAEILQANTVIPVTQINKEKVKVEPNHVYVIPPNKSLTMLDGHVALSSVESFEERRAPIDIFFRTLADSNDGRSVAVVLSGSGSDGSMGIGRIKENGGIVLVQDPVEAEFDGMPSSSIAQGLVDFILPVSKIPLQIIQYRNQRSNIHIAIKQEDEPKEEENEAALKDIFTCLRIKTGQDFSNYKRATILRRIERRMNVRELADLASYAIFIKSDNDEPQILLKELLISVTNFFRDKTAFESLEKQILPRIFKDKTEEDRVRIWVSACATGEEAYSIAMLCAEKAATLAFSPAIQIFASDLDSGALETAREGLYSNAEVADVSPERLRKFFLKEDNGYRVRREIRELILFARHNIIKDPPFSHLDLATCRNLLIYLNKTAQTRVLDTFHFALNPNGYLFLGSSETIDGSSDKFSTLDRENCIFQTRSFGSRVLLPVPEISNNHIVPIGSSVPYTKIVKPNLERISVPAIHYQLLELYGPPSILINGDYQIMHISESAGRFLQLSGQPSLNLLDVIVSELRVELRGALHKASQSGSTIQLTSIQLHFYNKPELIDIIVKPVKNELEIARGFFLIKFPLSDDLDKIPEKVVQIEASNEPLVFQLEEELTEARLQIRHGAEQYELQTEEFKASNEELQAINEELRSAAEELETSKEELQSVNEELITVNQELKVKIDELSQTNNDFKNLINATNIGTIFLDRKFGINLFTPAATDIFNLKAGDYGRPLSDITNRLNGADIIEDVEGVLKSLLPVEREINTTDGKIYLMQMQPYRTSEDHINGVVITFVNITARKEAENRALEYYSRTSEILESISDAFYAVDQNFNFIYVNAKAEEWWQKPHGTLLSKNYWSVFPDLKNTEFYDLHYRAMDEQLPVSFETFLNSHQRWIEIRLYPDKKGLSCYYNDITSRKNAEISLRDSEEKMRAIFSQTTAGVIQTDLDGNFIMINKRYCEMLGYNEEELIGQPIKKFIYEMDLGLFDKLFQELLDGNVSIESDQRFIQKDKNLIWLHNSISLIRGHEGLAQSVLAIAIDVTTQKEIEIKKDDFISIASHELKTPLTSVKAYAQILQEKLLLNSDEESAILTGKLNKQLTRISKLIEDLLDTSRIMEGKMSLHKTTFDVNSIIEESIETLSGMLNLQQIKFKFNPIPLFNGDRERISQILTNLISNAIKYAPGSEINIWTSASEGYINIYVQDFGKGLSENAAKKIFERFFRIDENNFSTSGMGLGLYISNEIAKIHGGNLSVDSKKGKGATFCLQLPIL